MSTDDDYDKLSKEEREARDKADREREAAEQAGAYRAHIPLRADTPAEASRLNSDMQCGSMSYNSGRVECELGKVHSVE